MKKARKALLAAVLAGTMILTGCSSGRANVSAGNTSGAEPAGTEAEGGMTAETKAAAARSSSEDAGKVVVNLNSSEQLTNLNPYTMANSGNYVHAEMIYDQPYLSDHMGGMTPGIVTSYDISGDGLTITLHVRDGVTFTNGDVCDGKDVFCTFDYICKNKDTLAAVSSVWKELAEVKLVDDHTVDLVLKEKKSNLEIAFGYVWIFSDEMFEAEGEQMFANGHLVGTGPWKFVKWVDGQYSKYERNPDWWGWNGQESNVDIVYIWYMTENSTAVSAAISKNLDFVEVEADLASMLDGQNEVELVTGVSEVMYYLGLKCNEPPFDDVNARLALAHCIDREAIVEGIMGGGRVMNNNFTSKLLGYKDTELKAYDPELAKQYLEKSGYDGRTLELYTRGPLLNGEDVLVAVGSYMEAVGFKVNINIVETATFVQIRKDAEYDVYLVNMGSYDLDPLTQYLTPVVRQDCYSTGYSNEELFGLIDLANQEYDKDKKKEYLEEICQIMYDEQGPQIGIFQPMKHYGVRKGLNGINMTMCSGTYFRYVSVDNPEAWKK